MIELSIVSADTKRELDKPIKISRAINYEIEKIEKEKMTTELKEKWIKQIFNTLKEDIENSTDWTSHCFDLDEFIAPNDFYTKNSVLTECFEIVTQLLEEAGYQTIFHEYSKGWQTRSGRFGYISVIWQKL